MEDERLELMRIFNTLFKYFRTGDGEEKFEKAWAEIVEDEEKLKEVLKLLFNDRPLYNYYYISDKSGGEWKCPVCGHDKHAIEYEVDTYCDRQIYDGYIQGDGVFIKMWTLCRMCDSKIRPMRFRMRSEMLNRNIVEALNSYREHNKV